MPRVTAVGAPLRIFTAALATRTNTFAPGDSTFILRRMLERGITHAAVGPSCDPVAVRTAFEAGEGGRLALRGSARSAPPRAIRWTGPAP